MNEGAGRGASAMAGELPQIGVRPPPLLFQFPSLSPSSSFWSVQQQQQPQQHSHQQHLTPASIFLTEQQLQMFHQQPQSHAFYQLQRPSPAAPDLNRPPLQAYLPPPFYGQQRQQQQQQQMVASQQQNSAVFRPPMVVPLVNRRPEATIMRPSGYPVAASAHEEVASDAGLFFQTLVQLSSDLGCELVVPRVGGKEFELHRLYCEVTELGGLEKVTREKRWKDIAAGFDLPETVTNPVYFLRKHYISLLHHYEQVYYHRKQGPLVPPPGDALPKPVLVEEKPKDVVSKKRGRSKSNSEASVGHVVTGAIEGKFEHGYFVTVVVGSEKLRGVIYNVPRDQKDDDAEKPAAEAPSPVKLPTKKSPRQKKRRRRARKDPDGIKSPRNPYNFFVAEQRQGLKGAREEMSRKIGNLWSGLSQEEKLPYAEMARKDKERYEKEKLEFGGCRPAGNDAVAADGCVNSVDQPMNPGSEPQQ